MKSVKLIWITIGAAVATVAVTALLVNIFEHKQEAKNPFYRVVELTDETEDPAIWGKNFPLQYDDYKRTVDQVRTRYGGSEAVQRTPHEGPAYQAGRRRRARGRTLAVLGIVTVAITWLTAEARLLLMLPTFVIGMALALLGAWWMSAGARAMRAALSHPLMRRTALILDRRSATALRGWWGRCTYYFELEFPNGTTAEFSYPGRGASEDLYVSGMTGIAYTRGDELLEFEQIRV